MSNYRPLLCIFGTFRDIEFYLPKWIFELSLNWLIPRIARTSFFPFHNTHEHHFQFIYMVINAEYLVLHVCKDY